MPSSLFTMMLTAVVHTQGVVLQSTYIPLEVAYHDVLGFSFHALITSPLSHDALRHFYPHARSDVTMVENGGTPYSDVLQQLRERACILSTHYPRVVFGYKGESYQPQILRDAGIVDILNVETLGVPRLPPTEEVCSWHTRRSSKCAWVSLRHILRHLPSDISSTAASRFRTCATAPSDKTNDNPSKGGHAC